MEYRTTACNYRLYIILQLNSVVVDNTILHELYVLYTCIIHIGWLMEISHLNKTTASF